MTERFFILLLAGFGGVFFYFGMKIDAPFLYGPVGPKAFPLFLGTSFTLLSLLCLWFHEALQVTIRKRVVKIAFILFLYILLFHFLGFMLATTLVVYAAARYVGSTWMQGLLTGLIISIFFYGVFHFLLQVHLPIGYIFKVLN